MRESDGRDAGRRTPVVKLIVAIIPPQKLEAVKEALAAEEVFRLTVIDVQGFGRQKGLTEVFRGSDVAASFVRKVEIQIAVNEDYVERSIQAIVKAGRSGGKGKVGDGKIFVLPIADCVRIRTGERGPEAI
jgi:nitrogen regulatory protein P-II 1